MNEVAPPEPVWRGLRASMGEGVGQRLEASAPDTACSARAQKSPLFDCFGLDDHVRFCLQPIVITEDFSSLIST